MQLVKPPKKGEYIKMNFNKDFYPTPTEIIHKMLAKIDFNYIKTILEPSGGKGDIIELINKRYSNNRNKLDIDTIEIDENLQHILKGKGFRLVHDDFLTFHSFKRYDLIIANFPFSDDDKHLLKAIELQEKGGQIVALINAETLTNPYSNNRKLLTRKLQEYNAAIEYIENAFINAERKTGVKIALIYINIPKVNDSIILDNLKKDSITDHEKSYGTNALIENDFIKGIVSQYNYEIKAGLKLIDEYNSLKPLMLSSFEDHGTPILKLKISDYSTDSLENEYIKSVRRKYWRTLFNNKEFIGQFTSNLRNKYQDKVEELENYDFSFFNIYTLRIELSKEMITGVEDTILNLFDEFSYKHYYDESSKNVHLFNGWKTNKAHKINKKVIIPLNAYNWYDNKYNPTDYKILDKLKDIEKVFNYLDGGKTEEMDITEALKIAGHYEETKKVELKYFYVTFFKKGTCHIEFKDMDLLHKFNLFGSQKKGWLPPFYAKKAYQDMNKEEKEVINSFEGKESYNKVMSNQDYFILNTNELLKLETTVV